MLVRVRAVLEDGRVIEFARDVVNEEGNFADLRAMLTRGARAIDCWMETPIRVARVPGGDLRDAVESGGGMPP
jgi:hypothetical protein